MLKKDLLEYENMKVSMPEKSNNIDYSGLNRELGLIFSHLTLGNNSDSEFYEKKTIDNIEKILREMPQESIQAMFNETASDL